NPAGPAKAAPPVVGAKAAPGVPPVPVKPEPAAAAPPKAAPPAKEDVTQPIKPADIGDVTLPMGAKAPKLRGITLAGPGAPIALGIGTFVVGRAAGCDVQLDDRQVSRQHARITVEEGAATIEDLQTVNGTLVNGKEVKTRQPLKAGDTVQFGASAFTVQLTT